MGDILFILTCFLGTPVLWLIMYFPVRRSKGGRTVYWYALAIYLLVAGGITVKVVFFASGMNDLPYIIFGGPAVGLYTLFCFAVALKIGYGTPERIRILGLPPSLRRRTKKNPSLPR
jgi:hypothetical protein